MKKFKDKNMRNVFIRVSAKNIIQSDDIENGVKEGDTVTYTKDDILAILKDWEETKAIKYFMIEHNDDPENIHYHIVICFPKDSVCKFSTIKNKFPYGHIDNCKYGVKACVQYLVHMNEDSDKHKYEWSEVVTNAPDKLEMYKIPGTVTTDAKLQHILEEILLGNIREYETEKIDPFVYIRNKSKIRDAFDYRKRIIAKDPNRNIQVIICVGPPRIGKSTFSKVYAQKHNLSICFSSASNDPWQEYEGQDIFVYDDFDYHKTNINDLKKAFDPHNTTSISARYKNRLFCGNYIFVCTNTAITEWYSWEPDVDRKALFARISCVLDFTRNENGVAYYTVNDIVESSEEEWKYDSCGRPDHAYTKMVLKPREGKVREFNLNRYIDIHADEYKTEEFISELDDI